MLPSLSAFQPVLDRLEGLSVGSMYVVMGVLAFLEGALPPIPGDVAAAFLAFLSARAGGLWLPTTLIITTGSVGGASVLWWIGKSFGAEWLTHQLGRLGLAKSELKAERAEHRIEDAYRQYGWVALFLSRFIPGVRAMVPIAAGAMRVPLWETLGIMWVSSLMWYSVLVWIAMRLGRDWEGVKAGMQQFAQGAGLGALGLAVILGIVGWVLWRRRRRLPPQ
ncbi:MAG: DedA family protein [Gemmatimonadaceae bacterium]|nr:DedA family protein [Gemmatimonadaceae bacterium]MCW5825140.1 DedA family protein [Gemmatimonadaceae bacterium]